MTGSLDRLITAAIVLSLGACTGADGSRTDTVQQGASAVVGDTALHPRPMPGATRDSMPGAVAVDAQSVLWDDSTVMARLRDAKLDPQRMGGVRQPFLGVPGLRIVVLNGAAEIQAFLYADAGAVGRDTKPLDSARVAPATMQISWIMPPSLVVDNNLAVIVLTRDDALRRRIHNALSPTTR